jgi:arabinofuranosyltransferase
VWVDDGGVSDERRFYYPYTGMLRAGDRTNDFEAEGRALRDAGDPVVEADSTGLRGFYAGPGVFVIDRYALSDPLLARLPPRYNPNLRVGHYQRHVPEGYVETLRTGDNRIADPDLAAYYDELALVTRGPLFSGDRWAAIWRLNTGGLDALIDFERYYYPTMQRAELAGGRWSAEGDLELSRDGIEIATGEPVRGGRLDIEYRGGGLDRIVLLDAGGEVAIVDASTPRAPAGQPVRAPVALPDRAFTRVRIFPRPRAHNADIYPLLDSVALSR